MPKRPLDSPGPVAASSERVMKKVLFHWSWHALPMLQTWL